jgi:hypothetical protein
MRRGKQSNAQTGRAINAFQDRAGGTFAVRPGDVNKAKFVLRIAREFGESKRIFQPEICAEQLKAVKKLDGFGISHVPTAWQMSKSFAIFFSTQIFTEALKNELRHIRHRFSFLSALLISAWIQPVNFFVKLKIFAHCHFGLCVRGKPRGTFLFNFCRWY